MYGNGREFMIISVRILLLRMLILLRAIFALFLVHFVTGLDFEVFRLRFFRVGGGDIAVFFENFNNFQVQAYDIVANGLITKNAAQVKANGVEISGSAKPLHALTINAAATFLDAKFKSFPGASCSNSQIAAGLCAANGTFNASGMATPASAKFTSSLEGIYEIPLDASHRVLLEGNYYHRSSLNFSPTASPLTEVGTVDLLGASIGLEWADSLKFSVFCKNCTNQLVPTYRALDPTDSALAHADSQQNTYGYDSVRTIGAAINAKF